MTPIEKLKALEAAAEPSPWERTYRCIDGPGEWDATMHIYDEGGHDENDAALIVALRNLAPAMIAWWEAHQALETPLPKNLSNEELGPIASAITRKEMAAFDAFKKKAAEILP